MESATATQALVDTATALSALSFELGVAIALAVFSASAFWGWRLLKGNPKD